jgi:phosphate transport system substrate-binding protein
MKTSTKVLLAWSASLWWTLAHAAGLDPWSVNHGPVRIEGPREAAGVVQRWIDGFRKQHPEIAIESHLRGTDVGIGALTTGRADIALAGREAAPQELKGFEWIYRYQPSAVEVMSGSLDHPGRSPALVVLVHRSNPLQAFSMAQLAGLFGVGPKSEGRATTPDTWGDLGLAGTWSRRGIRLYLPDVESGTGVFFRSQVLGDTRTLPWARLTEIADSALLGPRRHDAARRLAQAVAHDASAIAVAPLSERQPRSVKVVPLSQGSDAVLPSATGVVARTYPLARVVRAYVNAAPAQPIDPARAHPLDPRVKVFLQYLLSPDGQHDVEADGEYLPLDARRAIAQAESLQ